MRWLWITERMRVEAVMVCFKLLSHSWLGEFWHICQNSIFDFCAPVASDFSGVVELWWTGVPGANLSGWFRHYRGFLHIVALAGNFSVGDSQRGMSRMEVSHPMTSLSTWDIICFCHILTKIGTCRYILVKLPNLKLHDNPLSDSWVVECWHGEVNRCVFTAFRYNSLWGGDGFWARNQTRGLPSMKQEFWPLVRNKIVTVFVTGCVLHGVRTVCLWPSHILSLLFVQSSWMPHH